MLHCKCDFSVPSYCYCTRLDCFWGALFKKTFTDVKQRAPFKITIVKIMSFVYFVKEY